MKSKHLFMILFMIFVLFLVGCDGGGTITPNQSPIASFTANPTSGMAPLEVSFDAFNSSDPDGTIISYTWDFKDGDTGTGETIDHTFTSPGSYEVSLTIIDNEGATDTTIRTITVTEQATPTGSVHNLTKGIYYATIQEALDDAGMDNTIEVSDGIYNESITFPSGKKIILQSINGLTSTIIQGENNEYTINLDSSLYGTTIEGFTITHVTGQNGGGILNKISSKLTVDHCMISHNANVSDMGGGIDNEGTLTVNSSNVSDNNSGYGGGIYNEGTLTVTGSSTVSGNVDGYYGGGIFNNDGGTLTITGGSTVSGNSAGYGGGIKNDAGTLTITGKSTVSGNTANYGGGIDNNGTLTITGKSTVSGNTANKKGGGIDNYGALTINLSTISNNNASNYGGGIYNDGTLTVTGESTVSGNSADYGGGIYIKSSLITIIASNILGNSADYLGGGIYITSGTPPIGGSSNDKKNTICGNYLSGNSPSLDQQIRNNFGDLYNSYKFTNDISIFCMVTM